MKFIKKIWSWEKKQLQNPEVMIVIGVVGGMLIGVGAGNIGLGIALGVVFGITGYASMKKKEEDETESIEEVTAEAKKVIENSENN